MEIQRMGRSGQIYRYDIAGDTPTAEEIADFNSIVENNYGDSLEAALVPEQPKTDPDDVGLFETIGKAFGSGVDLAQLNILRAVEETARQRGADNIAREARESQETQIRQLQENPLPFTSYEQVDSVKDGLKFGAQTIAQQIPNLGASIAGSLIARKALPKGIQGTPKDILGAVGGQFPIHYGGSLLNEDELVAQGVKKEVDAGAAALYGVGKALLDGVSDLFVLGGLRFLGKPLLTKVEFKPLGSIPGRFGSGAVKGIAVESPTEVGQAILDRMHLGKDLLSDEAKQEYAEAAIAGGIARGGIR